MTRCASSGKMCWLTLAVTLSLTPLLPLHAEEEYLKTEVLQNHKDSLLGKRFVPANRLSGWTIRSSVHEDISTALRYFWDGMSHAQYGNIISQRLRKHSAK